MKTEESRHDLNRRNFAAQVWSPGFARALSFLLFLAVGPGFSADSLASSPGDAELIPHVRKNAQENFTLYQQAGNHRAFAIAPGGAWAWNADASSETEAEQKALQNCQANTQQKCVVYALDDRIVFDREQWSTLWGPYTSTGDAGKAPVGTGVGKQFYDLVWYDREGRPVSLSRLRGKIVFLHFWGSWCPPCMREFPSLRLLQTEVDRTLSADVEIVLLQMREAFSESRKWVEENGFSELPVYDSGVSGSDISSLTLASGEQIQDRQIARVFPSTYVLDRNGLVIFSHYGPVTDWLEYLPFFEHAVAGDNKSNGGQTTQQP